MVDSRPITAWAVAGLVTVSLAWLVGLPLPFLDYDSLIGGTAGVGVIFPLLAGLASAILGLLGLIFGVVGLARTASGVRRGQGMSWAAIVLGAVLLAAYVVVSSRFFLALW